MAAEAVLTFAAEGILNKVLSLAAQPFSLAWGLKAELRKLQDSFTSIELLLNNVADKPQDRPIEAWVKKLKDVAHDAEDVFDELEYEGYRRKVEIQDHMKKKVLNFFSLSNPLAFRLKMAHKIQKINASLVDLKSEASLLQLVSKNKVATTQGIRWDRQTNAFIGKDEIIIGRQDDVSKIVTTLTDSKYNQENLAVMAIVGMGGLGKTTLAKSVYNEGSVHKFFKKKIWICVSDTFDVNSILHQMSEQLNREKAPSKDNQNTLLLSLDEELKDKNYLLVLDDVWNEESKIWESFMECLSKLSSAKGSKIIVTTRKEKVALTSERLLPRHELGKLSRDQCWSIMKNRACSSNSNPEFDTIGREIAEKCRGVPLVAKVLGGILHTKKNIVEWSLFKKSRIWDNLSKGEDIIMPVLRLSFDNLESASLKQCFAYCSMFEKDFEIERDNLIQLWMAQGLLRPSHDESKEMEDIGNEYFDILLQSSLFQDATICNNGIVSKCKMHDLVHDLAEHLSKSESLTGDLCVIDNTLEIRHVARVSTSTLEKIPKRSVGKLRSLFSDDGEVPSNILPHFKALHVLNLSNTNIEGFPVSVGRLKHLRYLDISKTRFKVLPKSIGKLYNLQTLRATNCALKEFPKELQNLINLRHIYFHASTKFPQGIGRLTCLQTLPYFSVGNEIGRRIEELAGLKQLKGKLIVCNLEHVKNGEEAKKAKLEDKTKVRHLSFKWTANRSTTNNNEEDVLEGLRPHCELESLSIENFMGNKFPPWMMSGSLPLNNLKRIQLLGCDKCEGVPPFGHLPSLTDLKIRGMANLKCVGAEFYGYDLVHNVAKKSEEVITLFPALKVLYISECSDLNEWKQAPTTSRKKVVVFPCLEMLTVENCSKFGRAQSLLSSVQKLEMSSCEGLSRLPSGLKNYTSLQKLSIKNCDGLSGPLSLGASLLEVSIGNCNGISVPLSAWASLVELDISFCHNLTSIEMKGSGSLTASLQKLTILCCNELTSIPALPQQCPSLQELEIHGCPKLSWFGVKSSRVEKEEKCISLQSTSDLRTMTSLRLLRIYNCNGLSGPLSLGASLVEVILKNCNGLSGTLSVWASLEELDIYRCNNLTSIEMKGSGSLTASLQKLRIWFCNELTSIPALPQQCPSLQELDIRGCPKLSWFGVKSRRVEKEEKCISLQSTSDLRTMTSLLHLSIINCERLESWVSSLQFPFSLESLMIRGIPNLQILPSLDHLNSLRYLEIGGFWEELDSFPDFEVGSLMHLTELRLYGWPKLKSLPEWLGSLTSLTELFIQDCKNLMNLPSVQAMQRLTKLQTLRIYRCHPLLEERCRRDIGTDWPKISHIPNITSKFLNYLFASFIPCLH
ncbi:hypothetical protein C1H46_039301 [Malus baccata]|uniref:Uncharacterized protein n=1 Tax=Malus baccata TaxID=106549 RepID=A0A540KLR9_MALBA|nr:hypothetical protein C1H46_039301 [Malus baccata]